ncbi:MAG: hypothetical protein ABSH12_06250, partial [Endomicrobiales bacterium]
MITQEMTENLLKSFHLAITYLKIYPPTSKMVGATIDTLTKTLLTIFEQAPSVTLSELTGKLLIDGKEPATREIQLVGNNILKLFTQKKIQSITFRAGISREEVTEFVTSILQKKREELPAFDHIALDQTVYVAVVKGEEAVVKISEMVQHAGSDMGGLIKSLRDSYDLIDTLGDQPSKDRAQDHLAKELARQDTTVLRDIFERELPRKIETSGLKSKLLNELSQEKIQAIFGNISVWYDEIRQSEGSDFAAVERLEKLKMFIQTVLSAPAAKQIPLQFFEELLRKGLVEQLPSWFSVERQKPTTIFEVEKLLEKPSVELMEKETLSILPQIVEKLCQIENNELLGKLIEKVLENLNNSAAQIRLEAADSLVSLYEILIAHMRNPIIKFMELPLLEAARKETSPDVHNSLVTIVCKIARQNILYSEYDLATRIMEMLIQHTNPDLIFDEKIRASAVAAKQTLTAEVLDILIADLKSDNEKRKIGSMQILTKIGESAITPLIRVIKESDDIRSRRIAAEALKNLGPKAVRRFGEELNLGLTADEMRRVVDVLNIMVSDDT